jgi:predicted AlkP superfamily phosphohydrolase/phosphomutase
MNGPGRVADAALDSLGREDFDLVWLNFGSAHKAGHHLWNPDAVVDEPLDPVVSQELKAGLAQVYEAVDRAIARVLRVLPDEADVIVFSPSGMGANISRAELLPGMVEAVLSGRDGRPAERRALTAPIWTLRSKVPVEWRRKVARVLPDEVVAELAARLYLRRRWDRTLAMAVPGENKGYVRVNLKGREREGIVERSEMDALLGRIAEGLLTFRDSDGSPSIARVQRMSEMAEGPGADRLPDLVVHWGERPPDRTLLGVSSPVFGDVPRQGVGSGRSGNHVDDAWAILVPGASRTREIGRDPRITDIGTTACALLGGDTSGLAGTSLFEAP